MKKLIMVAILVFVVSIFGCGGGGSSSGDTSSSSSSSSSSGGVNTNATITGKIVNEGGSGIPSVSITISGVSSSTNESGDFTIGSLVVGTEYFLDISYPGRKTAHMKFTIQDYNPNLIVAITLPKGSGEASFELPASLNLRATTSGNFANLSWTPTSYANFIAYGLYRAEHSDVRTDDEEKGIRLAPNNIAYDDPIVSGTNYYYRIFEKDTIAELGATVMIGSNEVQTIYPVMESYSPTGIDVSVNLPIQITFSREMDQESVNNGFSIVSSYSGDSAITGTKTWSGNTFIFTPSENLGYVRTYTITITEAKDTLGNLLIGNSWSFITKSGYVFSTKWGPIGNSMWEKSPIAVDSSENVYLTDIPNNRIRKFSSAGEYKTQWSIYGTDAESYPRGISIDLLGAVFVVNRQNPRIQKFTSEGSLITKWGSEGSGNGQFNYPSGVAVDSSGNVYVADGDNYRIQKFTSTGSFITKWGSWGGNNGQFNFLKGIAVDLSGNVYVVDESRRIQKFTSTGFFITKWGSEGYGDGQFNYPSGVAVDLSGNVYVADESHRIQKFTSTGFFITKWGSEGYGDGQLYFPSGIAVDLSGNVYVVDSGNYRIQKFTPNP